MAAQYTTFTAGSVLTAAQLNAFLMKQVNVVCDSVADYPTSPPEGMEVYDKALDAKLRYTGAAWARVEVLAKPPGCMAQRTDVQSIANATTQFVSFTAADLRDTDAYHSTTVNPERLTVPAGLGGWYRWEGTARFAANATGPRLLSVGVNGAVLSEVVNVNAATSFGTQLSASTLILLVPGDYAGMIVYQGSGAALDTAACELSLTYVSAA